MLLTFGIFFISSVLFIFGSLKLSFFNFISMFLQHLLYFTCVFTLVFPVDLFILMEDWQKDVKVNISGKLATETFIIIYSVVDAGEGNSFVLLSFKDEASTLSTSGKHIFRFVAQLSSISKVAILKHHIPTSNIWKHLVVLFHIFGLRVEDLLWISHNITCKFGFRIFGRQFECWNFEVMNLFGWAFGIFFIQNSDG